MSKYYFFFVCWSCFFISCTSDSPLEQALSKSGKNRMQLEQVLKHYSLHPADSLKYRAACYLIANMPGHGWYEGEALDVYKQWIDSVYCGQSFIFKATLYEAFFQQPGATEGLVRYEDIEQLDSNFLITYIDSTFSAIRKRPWLKNLLFGQLCEYVLPYRVGHERPQQLFRLQDSIFNTDIADLLNYDDIGNEVATGIGLSQIFNGRIPREAKVLYRGNLINYNLTGCVSLAMLRSWLARLTLCPVALDLNPAFPTRNDRHCWSVMIDNRQMNSIQRLAFEVNKQGKIYRQTFTRNPAPVEHIGQTTVVQDLHPHGVFQTVTDEILHVDNAAAGQVCQDHAECHGQQDQRLKLFDDGQVQQKAAHADHNCVQVAARLAKLRKAGALENTDQSINKLCHALPPLLKRCGGVVYTRIAPAVLG